MGYQHIDNLYKNQNILMFRECYAMEKIHGTSAHVSWNDGKVGFFSGGEKHENFVKLFDAEKLTELFTGLGHQKLVVYGEAYGGKLQGMSATYGKDLRFVAFDVLHNERWFDVPTAEAICVALGVEFVHYVRCSTDLLELDIQRDKPSTQAQRNGIVDPRISEGVVLRPVYESTDHRGNRIISKHKRAEFRERKSIPNVDPAQREIAEKADEIAEEWVTEMRMSHVLDKLGLENDFKNIPAVIAAMQEDVTREALGEIVDNKAVRKAIGSAAVKMYKRRCGAIPSLQKEAAT